MQKRRRKRTLAKNLNEKTAQEMTAVAETAAVSLQLLRLSRVSNVKNSETRRVEVFVSLQFSHSCWGTRSLSKVSSVVSKQVVSLFLSRWPCLLPRIPLTIILSTLMEWTVTSLSLQATYSLKTSEATMSPPIMDWLWRKNSHLSRHLHLPLPVTFLRHPLAMTSTFWTILRQRTTELPQLVHHLHLRMVVQRQQRHGTQRMHFLKTTWQLFITNINNNINHSIIIKYHRICITNNNIKCINSFTTMETIMWIIITNNNSITAMRHPIKMKFTHLTFKNSIIKVPNRYPSVQSSIQSILLNNI